jgi:hypothetical protein
MGIGVGLGGVGFGGVGLGGFGVGGGAAILHPKPFFQDFIPGYLAIPWVFPNNACICFAPDALATLLLLFLGS